MTPTKKYHPFVVRLASTREAFLPELTDKELAQANDICEANAALDNTELSALLNKEFGLQARYDAYASRESDVDQIIKDFAAIIEKWKILPMCDSLTLAGSVMNHLNGTCAVMGDYIESLQSKSKKKRRRPRSN